MRAVVFAYHNVGCRCLSVLLAHGMEVALVVTHDDNPGETIWFDSVERLAGWHDLPVVKPADPEHGGVRRPGALRWRRIFCSRSTTGRCSRSALLEIPSRGALNMHGSLLPRYRGRVPVNWAVLHGERETGATLHYMVDKPDAGDIVAQQAVPILPEDTAVEVFNKVTVAAELSLDRALPGLLAGTAPRMPQDLSRGVLLRRPPSGGRPHRLEPAGGGDPQPGPSRLPALSRRLHAVAGRMVRFLRTLLQPGRPAASDARRSTAKRAAAMSNAPTAQCCASSASRWTVQCCPTRPFAGPATPRPCT